VPLGSDASYRAASDKAHLHAIAPHFGIAVPSQRIICRRDEPAPSDLRFPVAVKAARSVTDTGTIIKRGVAVRYANGAASLQAILNSTAAESFPLLVQERIVGPGVGVFLLLWEGQEIAAFSHLRLREKPPGGGVSVYAESIAPDPGLVARSRELLLSLGFEGVAMVEYKVDQATGVPYLMEVNGRFWGSLQLAIDAGVDFPQLLISTAIDGTIPSRPSPTIGVRNRWWWGDVDHLLARLRRSAEELGLPANAPSRWATIVNFIRSSGPANRDQILRMDDPRPAFRETLDWLRGR
jgi:predicted ATP-grasp superfamily ATP-dependent carboligase